jgi:hypothetical protein
MNPEVTLVVSGRYVVPVDGSGVLENAGVAVAGDTIVEIGSDLVENIPGPNSSTNPTG